MGNYTNNILPFGKKTPEQSEAYTPEQRELLQHYSETVQASFTMLHKMAYSSDPSTILRILGITTPPTTETTVTPTIELQAEPIVEPLQPAAQARQNVDQALKDAA